MSVFRFIAAGIALGQLLPGVFRSVGQMQGAQVNLPVGLLIWVMIVPMLMRVDFSALHEVRQHVRGTTWQGCTAIAMWQLGVGWVAFAGDDPGDFGGIPLASWGHPQERADSVKGFRDATQPILEFFVDHIGPYSYEKLAQVEATTVSGGMESVKRRRMW